MTSLRPVQDQSCAKLVGNLRRSHHYSLRDREQSHGQNRLWGGLRQSSSIFKRLTLQSKIPGSCTDTLNDILIILRIVGRDNRRRSQKIVRLVIAVANSVMIKISGGEVFEHVQKLDAVIENRRKLHDQSYGLTTSCATS